VIASRRLFLGTLADDVKLLAGQLYDLLQRLFEIHVFLSRGRLGRRGPRADVRMSVLVLPGRGWRRWPASARRSLEPARDHSLAPG
jgi:hypothetical protein